MFTARPTDVKWRCRWKFQWRWQARFILNPLVLAWVVAACSAGKPQAASCNQEGFDCGRGQEADVVSLKLPAPFHDPLLEYSSLVWRNENELLLLPQYPGRWRGGSIVGVSRASLRRCVAAEGEDRKQCKLDARWLSFQFSGCSFASFGGFEAMVVRGDKVFLTVELDDSELAGLIYAGRFVGDVLVVEEKPIAELPRIVGTPNMGYEALVDFADKGVLAIFERGEVDGAEQFLASSGRMIAVPSERIEHRITDATAADDQGSFWVINYRWAHAAWRSHQEPLSERYPPSGSHAGSPSVERLVQMRFDGTSTTIVDRVPIYLTLQGEQSRNWEGIVRFETGFLVVTDRYPETILGFVSEK